MSVPGSAVRPHGRSKGQKGKSPEAEDDRTAVVLAGPVRQGTGKVRAMKRLSPSGTGLPFGSFMNNG